MDCLPDDLIAEILSLLPTKDAVSTSVLSKKWRTLFALCHNLDLDNSILGQRNDIRKSFSGFVDSSLAIRGGRQIKKFSLKCNESNVLLLFYKDDRWICKALEHSVSELHLRIVPTFTGIIAIPDIPDKVFTSTTLVKLSLETGSFKELPPDTSLPALKVLLLDLIWFDGYQLLNEFLAACPALEDLTIRCERFDGHSYIISSKSIKKLSVTIKPSSHYDDSCSIIKLDTPNVVDLYYSDFPRQETLHFCNIDSLAKVTLDLHLLKDPNMKKDADMTNLVSGIRKVKTLHLTSSAVEFLLECCKSGLPLFENLTELVFASKKKGWRMFLPLLLERSPNLKSLVLSDLHCYTLGRRKAFIGIQIPSNNQIKKLRIMQYHGNEMNHIGHFLLKMKCVEVVKVYIAAEVDDIKKKQLTDDLSKLSTASSKVKIQVM
ncbi:putative F-box protein At3g44060 isoform X1 [Capsella rubella]|uniref:putative F-box protein At3g44060 isoform X1 n=1 Tax=Capsella rubella TaxID=81985 RepID=UPI000CD50013|nr:putative F-box protein At3g44060 isoform X1 [Capsella rubella]